MSSSINFFKLILIVPYYLASRVIMFIAIKMRKSKRAHNIKECQLSSSELRRVLNKNEPVVIKGFLGQFDFFKYLKPEYMIEAWGDREVLSLAADRSNFGFLTETADVYEISYKDFMNQVFYGEENPELRFYSRDGGCPEAVAEISNSQFDREFIDAGIWISEKNNITPFHFDSWHAFFGQTQGKKKITLISPFEAVQIYSKNIFRRNFNQSGKTDLPDNSSKIHTHDDYFKVTRYEAILNEGDCVYIPPGWWHHVESLDPSVSVLWRYRATKIELLGPQLFLDYWSEFLNAINYSEIYSVDSVSPAWRPGDDNLLKRAYCGDK